MLTQMISIIFRRMESDPVWDICHLSAVLIFFSKKMSNHDCYLCLTSFQSIIYVSKEIQDHSPSGSDRPTSDKSTSSSKTSEEASSAYDQNEKEMTLGDALSHDPVKDASIASLEELQNLAGGADIKVLTVKTIALTTAVVCCSFLSHFFFPPILSSEELIRVYLCHFSHFLDVNWSCIGFAGSGGHA